MSGIDYAEPIVPTQARIGRAYRAERTAMDVFDFFLALVALVILAPLMIMVTAAILIQDGKPIIFAHRRIGKDGRTFRVFKFRSMAVEAEERLARVLAEQPQARAEWTRDHKLRNDPRITRLGAFLRRSSLDELPQLFNVLRGEMSLVGPRPIVREEIEKYGRRFRNYASVKPGITGLWQVSGRNDVRYGTRVAMDCLYARRHSLALYLWILAVTVPAVLSRSGSY
jgi:exopolysaccharide production protein ExoY